MSAEPIRPGQVWRIAEWQHLCWYVPPHAANPADGSIRTRPPGHPITAVCATCGTAIAPSAFAPVDPEEPPTPDRPDPADVEALTDSERWEVLNAVMTEPSPEATMERIHGIIVARVAAERDRIRADVAGAAPRRHARRARRAAGAHRGGPMTGWADLYGSDPDYPARTVEQEYADALADRLEERAARYGAAAHSARRRMDRSPKPTELYEVTAWTRAMYRQRDYAAHAARLRDAARVVREEADR
jgi:hypothetical protein